MSSGGRGGEEAGVGIAAVAGDQNVATFGVKVGNGLGTLVLSHPVPHNVAESVKGFADLGAIRDVLRRLRILALGLKDMSLEDMIMSLALTKLYLT